MPLPEDEQRQLQQIERALYEDDPKFARRIRAGGPRVRYKRTLLRVLLGVVIGAGLLAAGAGHRPCLPGGGRPGDRAAVSGGGDGQPAAGPGPGPARAFGGGDHGGDGHETPARAEQAGPDDGADGPALAPPPGQHRREAGADPELIPAAWFPA